MRTEAEIKEELAQMIHRPHYGNYSRGIIEILRWVLEDPQPAPLNGEPRKTRATGRSHE